MALNTIPSDLFIVSICVFPIQLSPEGKHDEDRDPVVSGASHGARSTYQMPSGLVNGRPGSVWCVWWERGAAPEWR